MPRDLVQMWILEGNMGRRLSDEEIECVYALRDAGSSNKEIANAVCERYSRETLDRSTIQRLLRRRLVRETSDRSTIQSLSRIRTVDEAPSNFCKRGLHLWERETLSSMTPFHDIGKNGRPSGYFMNVGKRRTCRSCGKTEESTMVKGEGEQAIPTSEGIRKPIFLL